MPLASLRSAGLDGAVYDHPRREPHGDSLGAAAAFARDGAFDGFVSLGGVSAMDAAKAGWQLRHMASYSHCRPSS